MPRTASVKKPIRKKLVVMIALPVIFAYCLIATVQMQMGLKTAEENAYLNLSDSVVRHAKECELILTASSNVALCLADYMTVRNPETIEQITNFQKQLLKRYPGILGCAVAFEPNAFSHLPRSETAKIKNTLSPYVCRDDKDPNDLVYLDLALQYDYPNWEWYEKPAKLQKPIWTEPYFDEGGGDALMCTFSVPFYHDGEFAGIATIDIALDAIRSMFNQISDKHSGYLLCSERGTVIVATRHHDWEMRETLETLSDRYNDAILRSTGKEMVQGKTSTYLTWSPISNSRVFGAYAPLESVGWSLLKRTNEADILLPLYRQLKMSMVLFLVGLSLIIAVTLFASHRITKPLKRLLLFVNELAHQKWDAKITDINSQDEIEQLADVFNAMAKSLRDSIAESVQQTAAKESAVAGSNAKSQFLATMSHEMRTPLNGVIGISDLLMGTPLQPKQKEYAQLIKVSGESLLFLINDILDFSKIEAGKFELSPTVFNLQKMIDTVLRILSSRAEEKQLELVATVNRGVPLQVQGDEGRIRQILINLVGNALKFTNDGGIRIIVSLIDRTENQCNFRFEVIDTGIGIPADRQDRLFELFSQVDASTSRTYGGTGLGLAISKKLVELMKGDISVKSELGKGATFAFTVPMEAEPKNSPEFDSLISLMNRTQDKIHGQPILIATNSEFQHIALKEQFETWNFTTHIFSSCEGTLAALREAGEKNQPFFQVVVDTKLSDGRGEDLVHAIQGADDLSQTPIIYLIQLSDDSAQQQWKVPEKLQFVSKPVQSGILYNAITRLLELGERDIASADALKNQLNSLQHLRILVAEDNRINQIVIAEILKNAGIDFVLTANGEEALEKAKNETFEAVLMDCQMPVMDGFEATQEIREWEKETGKKRLPVIALTANVTVDDERRCFEAGMDAYCSKPVEPRRVIELLREWTRK